MPLPGGTPQVPCQEDAHDPVQVSLVDGQTQLAPVQHDVHRVVYRSLDRHGDHVDPGGHDLAHGDLVELHHVRHHMEFVFVDRALAVSDLGERPDLRAADRHRPRPPGPDPAAQVAERDQQRFHREYHYTEQVRGGLRKLPAEGGADGLGDDLGQDEYRQGERRRENSDHDIAEGARGDRAAKSGPDRMCYRVQGQDGRDGFVDPAFHRMQNVTGSVAAALEHGDVGVVDREQDGLENRAQEGNRQAGAYDDDELD